MDFLNEIFIQFFGELYLGLAEILIPDHKFKGWQEKLLKLFSILVSVAVLVCIGIGIAFFVDEEPDMLVGTILTSVGGGLFVIQTVIFIVVLVHQIKAERRAKQTEDCGLNRE